VNVAIRRKWRIDDRVIYSSSLASPFAKDGRTIGLNAIIRGGRTILSVNSLKQGFL